MQEIILVEKWVWMQESWKDELSSLSLAIYVCHPRKFTQDIFAGLLGCTRNFPWSFLLYFFVFFLLCSYWLHLYLFFDFLKERRLKKLFAPISHGSMQIRNLHLTLHSFLLRKVLGSSLESSLKSTGSHTKRKLISSSYSLKGTRKLSQTLYHSFMSGSMSIFPPQEP